MELPRLRRDVEDRAGAEPTIFDGVCNDMKIARAEIFGAVLSVIEVSDVDEAIRVANDTPYRLISSL